MNFFHFFLIEVYFSKNLKDKLTYANLMKDMFVGLASDQSINSEDKISLLNQYENPTRVHYKIFGLSWAGWVFDFYDLIYSHS